MDDHLDEERHGCEGALKEIFYVPRELDGWGYEGGWIGIWSGCVYLDVSDHIEKKQGCVGELCTQVFVLFWGIKVTKALRTGEVC